MSKLPPALLALGLALGANACAPTLRFNQSFLTAEELKLSDKGFASLKSTGETFDLGPIRKAEGRADKVVLLKVHGTYFVAGEGFRFLRNPWIRFTPHMYLSTSTETNYNAFSGNAIGF